MNTTEIREVFEAQLELSEGLPALIWPNTNAPAGLKTKVELTFVGSRRRMAGLNLREHTGSLTAIVCFPLGQGEDPAVAVAETLADAFPAGFRGAAGGTQLEVTETPTVQDGYPTDTNWRVPVTIPYRATPRP